ncbi:hypothetical protein A5881_000172 [Enterococcus termitis]|nr:hypothetical protein A5881_000380 [Enterococcus termitis]
MNILLKRQTSWGCVRHFRIYKNGVAKGKLFNNIPINLEVEPGDILEFREGLFYMSQKINITSETKEITITNTNRIQNLFYLFILLFLTISLFSLFIDSLKIFLATELSALLSLNLIFRYHSYTFHIEPEQKSITDHCGIENYKQENILTIK